MVPWTHLVCPPNWLTIGWAASAQDTIECATCVATGRIYAMNAIRLKELFISSPSSYQQCHHSKNNKMAHAKQKLHSNCQFVREICFTPGENTVQWKYKYQHRTPAIKEAMTFPSREWVVDEKNMRRDHWSGSVLYASITVLTLFFLRHSAHKNLLSLMPKGSHSKQKRREKPAPCSPTKLTVKWSYI